MPTTPHTAQAAASSSTSTPSPSASSNPQDCRQDLASPAASNALMRAPLSDSDDGLSDAPETPFFPVSPVSRTHCRPVLSDSDSDLSDTAETPVFPASPDSPDPPPNHPSNTPLPDSDSDLSDAPDSPVWPEAPRATSPPLRCTEQDCPVRLAVRRHNQGEYRHRGEPPETEETIFASSNPPPHVWESWWKIQAQDGSSTIVDDYNYFAFIRLHVDKPDTRFIGF